MSRALLHRTRRSLPIVLLSVCLLLLSRPVGAEWSGVSLSLGETDTAWSFSDFTTDVTLTEMFFRVEEKMSSDVRAGFAFGQSSLRLDPPGVSEVVRYDTNFLHFDLRWPLTFDYGLSLQTEIGWRYNAGSGTNNEITADARWTHGWVGVFPGLQLGQWRVSPYWLAHRLDGDLGLDGRQRRFSREKALSSGLNIDYLVDSTSFVRLNLGAAGDQGFLIEFIRRH